jgi:hypothetical protein
VTTNGAEGAWIRKAIGLVAVVGVWLIGIAAVAHWRGSTEDPRFAVLMSVDQATLDDLTAVDPDAFATLTAALGPAPRVSPVVLRDPFEEFAALFSTGRNGPQPVVAVSGQRAREVTAQLSAGAFIPTGAGAGWTVPGPIVADRVRLAGSRGSDHIVVTVQGLAGTHLVGRKAEGIAVERDDGAAAQVIVSVTDNLNRPLALDVSWGGVLRVWMEPLQEH